METWTKLRGIKRLPHSRGKKHLFLLQPMLLLVDWTFLTLEPLSTTTSLETLTLILIELVELAEQAKKVMLIPLLPKKTRNLQGTSFEILKGLIKMFLKIC